jgi:hypothetical protein
MWVTLALKLPSVAAPGERWTLGKSPNISRAGFRLFHLNTLNLFFKKKKKKFVISSSFFSSSFSVLGIKSRVLSMLSTCCTTKLDPQPYKY